MNSTGFCTNPSCARAASAEPVECYPGAGEYCPDCGERLSYGSAGRSTSWDRLRSRLPRPAPAVAFLVVAVLALGGAGIAVSRSTNFLGVRVCSTTMTDRVASEVVRDYAARRGGWPFHYDLVPPGNTACDVRFIAATDGPKEAVIAHDGVVVVVNPQNPVSRIGVNQLRDVMTGRINDWSQLGGRRGPILVMLTDDRSDETRILDDTVMQRGTVGGQVQRAPSTADLVRSVTSPSGVRSIGIASFSASSPAKVIAIARAPAPSPLSIADDRYPMSVKILCESDYRRPSQAAAGLMAFALSQAAQPLVASTGLLSKDGF